jgi:hypothetical protein
LIPPILFLRQHLQILPLLLEDLITLLIAKIFINIHLNIHAIVCEKSKPKPYQNYLNTND